MLPMLQIFSISHYLLLAFPILLFVSIFIFINFFVERYSNLHVKRSMCNWNEDDWMKVIRVDESSFEFSKNNYKFEFGNKLIRGITLISLHHHSSLVKHL